MDRCVGGAALLPESDRKDLAVQALARAATISDLATHHGVSRKFVYRQTNKARTALDDAFLSAAPEDEVLFEVTVTRTWLRQVIVGLTLICRGSYRGVVEFLRDLLGVSISIGTIHHVLQEATRQAGSINREQDLSGIRAGLHDEIFQGAMPVLTGVDAASTYCYLLAVAEHRDADTRGACICSTPPGKGCSLTIQLPMPGKVCAPGRRPPGMTRPAYVSDEIMWRRHRGTVDSEAMCRFSRHINIVVVLSNTTHRYAAADVEMMRRNPDQTGVANKPPVRYQPKDAVLRLLEAL